jgi:hypothetical protein
VSLKQIPDEVLVRGDPLVVRQMRDEPEEYERMVRWRNLPHIREWWDPEEPPPTLEGTQAKYGPRTRAGSPTTACPAHGFDVLE